jgi:hypothetical protein
MLRAAVLVVLSAVAAGVVASAINNRGLIAARAAGAQSFTSGYACYPGQFRGFRQPASLMLRDLLIRRTRSVPLGPPGTVCAPATSGRRPSRSKGYLVCYPTTRISLSFAARLRSKVLGDLKLSSTSRRDVVCVESKRVDERTGHPRSTSRLFVCYETRRVRAGTRMLRVTDAFGITQRNSAAAPYRGCAAAGENSLPGSLPRYLVCSKVNSERAAGSAVLKNRFGYLRAALGPRTVVCVEATR